MNKKFIVRLSEEEREVCRQVDRAGAPQASEELFRRYASRLIALARSRLPPHMIRARSAPPSKANPCRVVNNGWQQRKAHGLYRLNSP
jgi:hypothetical protein